jgi:hypothetical protein
VLELNSAADFDVRYSMGAEAVYEQAARALGSPPSVLWLRIGWMALGKRGERPCNIER